MVKTRAQEARELARDNPETKEQKSKVNAESQDHEQSSKETIGAQSKKEHSAAKRKKGDDESAQVKSEEEEAENPPKRRSPPSPQKESSSPEAHKETKKNEEASSEEEHETVSVNRAPTLQLWAAVVIQRQGYEWESALSMGKAIGAFMAQSKGRRLGIMHEHEESTEEKKSHEKEKEKLDVYKVFNLSVRGKKCDDGIIRAVKAEQVLSGKDTEEYIKTAMGEHYDHTKEAMEELANAYGDDVDRLAKDAYKLYTYFRPPTRSDTEGWGQRGTLDLEHIRDLAKQHIEAQREE